jgi:hypothetical protein
MEMNKELKRGCLMEIWILAEKSHNSGSKRDKNAFLNF